MTEDTTRRDDLARERTIMANERTLLAYARTALGVAVVVLFVIKFLPHPTGLLLSVPFALLGVAVAAWGIYRYRKAASRLVDDSSG